MTDKVQKIKDWISKEQDGLMDAQGNFEYPEHEGAYHILCNLDTYIDSLQEEPAPKIFEDMLNAKTPAESLGISAEEHEKIIDLCLYGKELEMVDVDDLPKEEPAPQFKVGDTIRSKHWHTAVHKITSMDDKAYHLDNGGKVDLSSQQLWELVEESVSEDLEKAAEDYGIRQGLELKPFAIKYFKAGANWQKQQDQSTIELAEDHAMLAGMEKMKEQMMAKAVEGGCFSYKNGFVHISCDIDEHLTDIKIGDKVKVIVIKEN